MPLKTLFLVQYTVYIALFYVTLNAREMQVSASDAYTNVSTINREHILSYLGDDSERQRRVHQCEDYQQRTHSIIPRGRQSTRA